MNREEQDIPTVSPEWIQLRIEEEKRLQMAFQEAEANQKLAEEYELRRLKLEAFNLAARIKPSEYASQIGLGGQKSNKYGAKDLIKDAELIYQSLLNK